MKKRGILFKISLHWNFTQAQFLLAKQINSLDIDILKRSSRIQVPEGLEVIYFAFRHLLRNTHSQRVLGKRRYRVIRYFLLFVTHKTRLASPENKHREFQQILDSTKWRGS